MRRRKNGSLDRLRLLLRLRQLSALHRGPPSSHPPLPPLLLPCSRGEGRRSGRTSCRDLPDWRRPQFPVLLGCLHLPLGWPHPQPREAPLPHHRVVRPFRRPSRPPLLRCRALAPFRRMPLPRLSLPRRPLCSQTRPLRRRLLAPVARLASSRCLHPFLQLPRRLLPRSARQASKGRPCRQLHSPRARPLLPQSPCAPTLRLSRAQRSPI